MLLLRILLAPIALLRLPVDLWHAHRAQKRLRVLLGSR
jgi:hypothetical protein